MYPFKTALTTTLVHSEWYVVGTSAELTGEPLSRTILGQPIALFRDGHGAAVMLDGLCPHRGYPLGAGKVLDGQIQCGYHGLRFDRSGACTFVPGSAKPSRFLKLRSYGVVERGGWIWAWMGAPGDADTARLPALGAAAIDDPSWHHYPESLYELFACRYMLLLENLMDLSHLSYLHGDVVQDTSIADQPLEVTDGSDGSILATRYLNRSAIGFLEAAMFGAEPGSGTYDLTNVSEYHAPSLIITGNRVSNGPDGFGDFLFVHAVTPETETTTHYWVSEARDFRVEDSELDGLFAHMRSVIPYQDKVALELLEPVPDTFKFSEKSQHFDKGALKVRAAIESRLIQEQVIASTPAHAIPVLAEP